MSLPVPARAVANASVNATVAGTIAATDTFGLTFTNPGVGGSPLALPPVTAGAGATATSVAAKLVAAIKNNAKLAQADITAAAVAGVVTLVGPGAIHNGTTVTAQVTGTGTLTVANSGVMAGGIGDLRPRAPAQTGARTKVPGLQDAGGGYVSGPSQRAVDPVAAGIDTSTL